MMSLTKSEIRRKYDRLARKYDFFDSMFLEPLGLSRLRRKLFSGASGKVLETAVGAGINLRYLPRDCSVTAIDMSLSMLKRAGRRVERYGLEVDFKIMDVENLEFEDNSFDTVIDSLSLCTFPAPLKALAEMERVCKPGGTILLLEHGKSCYRPVGKIQDRWAEGHSKMLGCNWNREPLELVRQAGLNVKRYSRYFAGILFAIEINV